jgi:hypothetical protein
MASNSLSVRLNASLIDSASCLSFSFRRALSSSPRLVRLIAASVGSIDASAVCDVRDVCGLRIELMLLARFAGAELCPFEAPCGALEVWERGVAASSSSAERERLRGLGAGGEGCGW